MGYISAMKVYYYDHWTFPLPPHHRFPTDKYRLLRERLLEHDPAGVELIPAPAAAAGQLLLAHSETYVTQIETGTLPPALERELGLPLSPELARRVRHTVGATIAAGRAARTEGIAATTGGGTHHAQWDRPQGYCIFNDAVVAVRVLQREKAIRRALIIDCDVHQGNGTAALTADDPTIFTFSIHCRQNFPARKIPGDLDIDLNAGVGDAIYLEALRSGLAVAFERAHADFVVYLAGADPFEGDRLGRLNLSKKGLADRDRLVLEGCARRGLPVVVTMAGGYGRDIHDTVDFYHQTIRLAAGTAPAYSNYLPADRPAAGAA